ncbi:MAG TPA: proton-conducting transporter membrane subunit, partial [Ornithinimicrobium sp.]|uniref:NADH-quinone oxidoreductase subunit 5 family protein n=1 Tax=Ornithinimicrobium sp. TaxID=1977084 RepID=UPI002B49F8A0
LQLSVGSALALTSLVVALVSLVVQTFARWYLWYDPRYRQFASTIALFTAAMMLVVHSGDVVLTLVGWEVMGWCSFLLIGHFSAKATARRAASKALLVTRVADIGFVLGIIALAAGARSTSIEAIVEHWQTRPGLPLTSALVLLIIGVAGKSALFPFQDWLPDAMEGPTPASALIHAATMVAAGTVVLAQMFPLLHASDPARLMLALLASVSILAAALMAFAQPDLKRLLAWSTVSQVALMLAALSATPPAAGPDTALVHLMSHAFFKALLFLTIGWLAVLCGGTVVAYVASGARRYRSVRRPLAFGLLALAGVPPFVGFVSKELILSAAEEGAQAGVGASAVVVLAAVGASAPLTAAYCMRAWLIVDRKTALVAAGPPGGSAKQIDDFFADPHVLAEAIGVEEAESAISSTARSGITVLTLLTLVGGVLPFTALVDIELTFNLPVLLVSLGLMAAAAVAVWAASRGVRSRDAAARLPASLRLWAERGGGFDRAYDVVMVRPVLRLARGVLWLDTTVLDAYVRAVGMAPGFIGAGGHRLTPVRPGPALVLVLTGLLVLALLGVLLR